MTTLSLALLLQMSLVSSDGTRYADAYQKTASTGQPLVVLVGTDWCPGCVTMKNAVIPQLQRAGGLNRVSFALVNADSERELAGKLMRGGSIPPIDCVPQDDRRGLEARSSDRSPLGGRYPVVYQPGRRPSGDETDQSLGFWPPRTARPQHPSGGAAGQRPQHGRPQHGHPPNASAVGGCLFFFRPALRHRAAFGSRPVQPTGR